MTQNPNESRASRQYSYSFDMPHSIYIWRVARVGNLNFDSTTIAYD